MHRCPDVAAGRQISRVAVAGRKPWMAVDAAVLLLFTHLPLTMLLFMSL